MSRVQIGQPEAAAPQAPPEDAGSWSLGAAALMFLLFFGVQVAVAGPVVAVLLLVTPREAIGGTENLLMSGAVLGPLTFASDGLFLLLVYLIWIRPRRRPLRRALALVPSRFALWIAIPVAVGTGLVLDGISLLLRQPISPAIVRALVSSPLSAVVLGSVLVTIVPLTEEVYFRGVLWAALRRRVNVPAAVLVSSAVFALVHVTTYGLMAVVLLQAFAMGVVLAVLRARGGSIAPYILAHAVLNLVATLEAVLLPG